MALALSISQLSSLQASCPANISWPVNTSPGSHRLRPQSGNLLPCWQRPSPLTTQRFLRSLTMTLTWGTSTGRPGLTTQPRTTPPWISADKLEAVAARVGYNNREELSYNLGNLRQGADIGVIGSSRLHAVGPNLPGFLSLGYRSADTIATWVKKQLVYGPLTREQLPPSFRSSPIQAALKPSGRIRICLDFSWPWRARGTPKDQVDLSSTTPTSLNDGIRGDWPVWMISCKDVLYRLLYCNPSSMMSKIDWLDAYK